MTTVLPYKILIGLEVHVQLHTETKLFCGCGTKFDMPPNSQTCPVCIGMPGVLPVMNRRAFELALKAALALDCRLSSFTKWDRKNYYYPDLPKNYQISQYDLPFAVGGEVTIPLADGTKQIRLIRVHLEEDAGKNLHADGGGDSLVDLNRAGTPLLEVVSEPDMTTPTEAAAYLETLRTLLRDLEVSDCEMQEGSLRCDANVNLHITKEGQIYKTPLVEIKNMNSIRAVEKAIEYEVQRQYDQWQTDGKVMGTTSKQTRGWVEKTGITRAQRDKEEASDYRYFPEPDLVPVVLDDAWLEKMRGEVGETSAARKQRFITQLGLSEYHADVLVSKGRAIADYFEVLLTCGVEPKAGANWVINDLLSHAVGRIKTMQQLPLAPARLAELIAMVKDNKLNLNDAREKVLPRMVGSEKTAAVIAQEENLTVVVDLSAIETIVDDVLLDKAQAAADYRAGKQKAFGSLVGEVMKRSKGKFPPNLVNETLLKKLGG